MDDELDLGVAPSTKRKRALPGAPKPVRTWRLHKPKNPQMCDICINTVEKVDGWPTHAVNRALYVERGPDGNVYLCIIHKEERESAFREAP